MEWGWREKAPLDFAGQVLRYVVVREKEIICGLQKEGEKTTITLKFHLSRGNYFLLYKIASANAREERDHERGK